MEVPHARDAVDLREMTGTLIGVGVGPGDPELVTLKADRLIRSADAIAYPAPEGGESFARSIVADSIPQGIPEVQIAIPMVDERFPAQEAYDRAEREIAAHLRECRDVVAICQGDPFFFGSFMYLFQRISKRFRVSVVPGVTSMSACAAAAARPLCARMETVSVIPAPLEEAELEKRLAESGAAVFVKVGRHLPKLRRVVARLGLADRSVFIAHASLPAQLVCPLEEAPSRAPYFSIVLVPGVDPYAS